jgi:hypothetical protein
MDFHVVSIERPSARVLGKLRKGKKVRVSKGCGMQIVVHASRINPMTRCFDKGKAHTIELTPEEVTMNRSADMSGSGLFDDIRGGFEKLGKELKPVAEKVGKAIEPVAKQAAGQALDYLADQAPTIGASALSGLALFAGQPELVPLAQMAGRAGGQALGNLARNEGKKALGMNAPASAPAPQAEYDDMIRELPMPPRRNAPPSRGVATNVLSEKSLADYSEDELGKEIARRRGGYSSPLDKSGGKQVLSPYVSAVGQGMHGGGLGAGMRERSTVGVRGNLIGCGTPPALMSQPYASNFQMASRLPPQYAQLIHS